MQFTYEGFTHFGDKRCFLFKGVEERNPVSAFSIEIDLPLLVKNRVSVQEGPMFCLQLLTNASLVGANSLDKLHTYKVIGEDFRPLLVERERKAAEKALRKPARKPARKPPSTSNLHLGIGMRDR
jgi:hypothetical protein